MGKKTGGATASFDVDLNVLGGGEVDGAARSVEQLFDAVTSGESKMREIDGQLRRLKGTSKEVLDVKERLRGQRLTELKAVSTATVALDKQGASVTSLQDKQKKAAKEAEAATLRAERSQDLAKLVGGNALGKVNAARESVMKLGEALQSSSKGGLALAAAGGTAVAAIAAIGIAGAVAYKVYELAESFSRYALEVGNASRAANLMREAAFGNAADAGRMGNQVERLARGLPIARTQINDMAVSLSKAGLGGQTFVDTLEAMSGASAAVGDDLSGKIKGLVEAGRQSGRFALQRMDLQGTGLDFKDVASALAQEMHVGVQEAAQALASGRVRLADGAEALKRAVNTRFGDVNGKKMLDLNVQAVMFRQNIERMFAGLNMEPFLKAVSSIVAMFGDGTVTGKAMGASVKSLAQWMLDVGTRAAPLVVDTIEQITLNGLRAAVAFKRWYNSLSPETISAALTGIKVVAVGLGVVVGVVGFAMAAALAPFVAAAAAAVVVVGGLAIGVFKLAKTVGESLRSAFDWASSLQWSDIGTQVVDGIAAGIKSGSSRAVAAITGLGDDLVGGFKNKLGIQSPSRVFYTQAGHVVSGVVNALEDGAPRAGAAAGRLLAAGDLGVATVSAGRSRGEGGVTLNATINFYGSAAPSASTGASIKTQLTEAVEELMIQAGLLPA